MKALQNIALSLISLILCNFIAHGFSLQQTDVTCVNPEVTTDIRGGALSDVKPQSQKLILDFLNANTSGNFHIQGWRWHFMSLIRDTDRFTRLAEYLMQNEDDLGVLETAAEFVVNFNMAGLHRVEEKMFVGWLRDNLSVGGVQEFCDNGTEVARAFREVIDTVDEHRVQSSRMGKELYEKAKAASTKAKTRHQREQQSYEIIQLASRLSERLRLMRVLQETLLVPAISVVVPSKSQKSFNNRVLLKLGVLESRVHLVGMHDAVWESGIESEKAAFQVEIPYVARIMIERWRKSLYNPKAGVLDYELK